MPSGDRLAISGDEFRRLGRAAVERIADYYRDLSDRPIVEPTTSAALRAALEEPIPEEGAGFDAILEQLEATVFHYSRHNAHPRFFGYISSPGTPVNAIGAMLESALNINVTCWRSAPAGTEMEHVTIGWLKQMLGYPAEAGGLFTSGGSMANFAALAAARTAKAPVDVVRDGMGGVGRPMCLYVSEEGHFSIAKAAGMLGLGEANVRAVRTDDRLRMDLEHLAALVRADRAAGALPFCVVANAGTTATGAIDPISALAGFAREQGLWLHVDAAYGGFAALVPEVRRAFAGIERADSVALDPHKWLYLPVGCGCVLYRDPEAARAAFRHDAEYTRAIGLERDEAFAFWDYGPELSRPFRALGLWLILKYVGARRLAEAIANNIACAHALEDLVRKDPDFEMLAPVELSVFCFRYRAAEGDLNALNERIVMALNRSGRTYLSNASVRGNFGLRGCVLNYRTSERDMAQVLADVRNAALTRPAGGCHTPVE
jgi:glutamate/tyrosine decarboxylase-like PLP-dependent enzyme